MNSFASLAVVVGLTASASLPALAEDVPVATLQVGKGVVMTSAGGEFTTAHSGQSLVVNERVMVSKDAVATVIYNADNCQQSYRDPGVYTIAKSCRAADIGAGATSSSSSGAPGVGGNVAFIAASAAAAGLIAHNINDDNNNEQPISR